MSRNIDNSKMAIRTLEEFKKYVDEELYKFLIDSFAGTFTFVVAFKEFQIEWAKSYLLEKYNFKTIRIGSSEVSKLCIFKPGFKLVMQDLIFHPELIQTLENDSNLNFELDKYHAEMNHSMLLKDGAALEFAEPMLIKLPENSDKMFLRKKLPIWKHRKQFMRQMISNQVIIVSGGRGIGKSTQLPQYVMEYMTFRKMKSRIICVYPYRLVAMTTAKRVSIERGEYLGTTVGYRTPNRIEHLSHTPVIFCTSEILLRTLINDGIFVSTTTHIIIDNIDVRDKYTDLVLSYLRRCLTLYPKIKLILVSGSSNNKLFTDYFKGASVLNIPASNTDNFELNEYFLEDLCQLIGPKLRDHDLLRTLPRPRARDNLNGYYFPDPLDESIDMNLVSEIILYICINKPMGTILVYLPAFEDIKELQELIMSRDEFLQIRYNLFFLHRMINISNQYNMFFKSKKTRKIILGTALAESAFYLDDLYYVIDIGFIRETKFDARTCLSNVQMSWISQAAAKRRSTGMGKNLHGPVECYRLYSRMEYRKLPIYDTAEILMSPITDLCLLSRQIISPNILLHQFLNRCIQPPPKDVIDSSVKYLKQIGAFNDDESLTPWGYIMAKMPIEPRLTKMLMFGLAFNCIEPVVTLVSFISLRGPWPLPALPEDQPFLANRLRQYSCGMHSDHLSLLGLFTAWQRANLDGKKKMFCRNHFLREGIMDLLILKRKELLTQLYCLTYLKNVPSAAVEERNAQGSSWPVIKACLTVGLAPQFAFVDRQNCMIKTNFLDKLQIGNQSVCHRGLRSLPTDWLIYEASVSQIGVQNMTSITPLLLILFGSHCPWELNDFIDESEPTEHRSILILNQWVYFFDKYLPLKTIIDMKTNIEKHMLLFLTVPNIFSGPNADKTFDLLGLTLNKEDRCTQFKRRKFGKKPLISCTRLNYASQPFDISECSDVETQHEIFLTTLLMDYHSECITSVSSENAESATKPAVCGMLKQYLNPW